MRRYSNPHLPLPYLTWCDDISYVCFSVAARQAAKVKKLETENEKTADAKSEDASTEDAVSKDNSSLDALTAAEDAKPEFSYKLPPALEGLPNLPPSVLPPPADAFTGELPQWGWRLMSVVGEFKINAASGIAWISSLGIENRKIRSKVLSVLHDLLLISYWARLQLTVYVCESYVDRLKDGIWMWFAALMWLIVHLHIFLQILPTIDFSHKQDWFHGLEDHWTDSLYYQFLVFLS